MFSDFSVILSHSNIANCYLLGSTKREYAWKVKKYSHKDFYTHSNKMHK